MIGRREILGLLPHVVEKDYVLGWVLVGNCRHQALALNWIFKGGTCLKKCYFETYRFSEDPEISLTYLSQIESDSLAGIFHDVTEWMYEQTGRWRKPSALISRWMSRLCLMPSGTTCGRHESPSVH